MKITIDGKEFSSFEDEKNRHTFRIELKSDDDIYFFARWLKTCYDGRCKSEYAKTVYYETLTRKGTLLNVTPKLGLNEDFALILYEKMSEYEWKNF